MVDVALKCFGGNIPPDSHTEDEGEVGERQPGM